jgi:outer membrane lipoprotein-sorting protein
MKRREGFRWLGLAAVLGVAASASAYVPPASFILDKMAARLASVRGVSATWAGSLYGEAGVGSARATSGRLHLAAPDRFRLEMRVDETTRVESWSGSSKTVRSGETARTEVASGPHPLPSLFLGGSPRATLREKGVDLGVVHLGRLGSSICWVIGATAEDPTRPQLWVDKETFLPLRWVELEGQGETRRRVEWRFEDYDPVESARAFPQTLERWVDGRRVLRMVLQTLDVRDVPRDSLFLGGGSDRR